MAGYIQQINTKIPYSNREVNINVQGKNVIFTGGNGCGKTQLLNSLHQIMVSRVINRQNPDEKNIDTSLKSSKLYLCTLNQADAQYQSALSQINLYEKQLEEIRNPAIIIDNTEQFVIRYHKSKALLSKFDATRQANIKESKAAVSKKNLKGQADRLRQDAKTATLFEEYLVSHKTAQAYAESPSIGNNQKEANQIRDWFDKLQGDLRELFEDQLLELSFDTEIQSFFIKQKDKEPYRLQQLSSGFSSIIAVYADLLMNVELRAIAPEDIDGVVFIDEIDAHLHVSLQRKILHFLVRAFPKVQFIVATHSPFVVSSVNDAIIYDLSRLEQIDDLSMYSYEAVLDGLFNVLPISEILKEKISELSQLTNSEDSDLLKLEKLLSEVRPHENKLDDESAYFLKMAQLALNKSTKVEM